MYDNALGRFYGIDKLSEVTPGITPFHFGYNSPLLMSDPSGLLSQSFIQSLWDNSSSSGWNSWANNGGDFFNNSGTIGINGINGERTNYEGLPNINIRSSRTASQNGILVQDHVYKTAGGYQYFRDGLREKGLDNLQHSLDVIGTVPGLGEVADLINSGISYGRGDYVGASLSLAATVPFIGVGATVAKAGIRAEKVSGSYLLRFQSGMFYAGKGMEPRMKQSIKRIENDYGDKLLESQFFPATSTKEAFKNEHKIMMKYGGPKSFDPSSPTYNKIFSPGKNF